MFRSIFAALLLLPLTLSAVQSRVVVPFDSAWRFFRGDVPSGQDPDLEDNLWSIVSLPHDFSILGPFDPKVSAGGAGAFLPTGIAWYRKEFLLPGAYEGQRLFLEFDGVMANSEVWLNGVSLGKRPNGYVSFSYELTPYLRTGQKEMNTLAVRVDTSLQPASRWYAGSGIYRHVRLVILNPVHIPLWATFVTTPRISASGATVFIDTAVVNQSEKPHQVSVEIRILAPDGGAIRTLETRTGDIAPQATQSFHADAPIPEPQLWNLAGASSNSAMYKAVLRVRDSGNTVDEETTSFGIREYHFAAATGFWLNGRNFKIKGVAVHEDGGAFGMAVPLSIWERRLRELEEVGVNAIRTGAHPFSPQFLDLCDRLGLVVLDDTFDVWTRAKLPYDYHLYFDEWAKRDVRDIVLRDRNHPSVILYDAGNEIRETGDADQAKHTLQSLLDVFHAADPTRPVTQALFRPHVSHDYDDGFADMLDVIGQNYREDEILAAHDAKPSRRILGTENGHELRAWQALRDHPAYAGQFLWSGFDYLGESNLWPRTSSGSGLFDRTGAWKPLAYQRQSWWSGRPMVYIARRVRPASNRSTDGDFGPLDRPLTLSSDWTPADLTPHLEEVEVYSNCDSVELILNGKSLGAQARPTAPLDKDAPRVWRIEFAPGKLEAQASDGGKLVADYELRTAGKPARVLLQSDRPDLPHSPEEVVILRATLVDAEGVRVPSAAGTITFEGKGPAVIEAVDNGDLRWHEPFRGVSCPAYDAQCVAILRANQPQGTITMTAVAPGLERSSPITIQVVQASRFPRY